MQVHQGMQYGTPAASMYQPQQYMPIPQHQQNEQLRQFWIQQHREVQEVGTDPAEFKNHQLPLARIKKVGHSPSDHHHFTKAFHLLTIFFSPCLLTWRQSCSLCTYMVINDGVHHLC